MRHFLLSVCADGHATHYQFQQMCLARPENCQDSSGNEYLLCHLEMPYPALLKTKQLVQFGEECAYFQPFETAGSYSFAHQF